VIGYWIARFVLSTVSLCPPLAYLYIKLLDLALPRYRRVAQRNFEIAGMPDVTGAMFRSIARILVTFAKFPSMNRDNIHRWIRYDGLENLKTAQARGRGVLIATAHFGNWELSAFAHALMSSPMHIVVRPLDNLRVDSLVEQRRAMSGNRIIQKKNAARDILRALKAGDAVGVLIDQNTVLEECVFVDFFGVKACAGAHFARFAHHSGAAVVPGYAVWSEEERRYILRFDPEIEMRGDIQQDTQRIHSHLESVIRRHPEQYLWIHRRWKTRPPGEASLY